MGLVTLKGGENTYFCLNLFILRIYLFAFGHWTVLLQYWIMSNVKIWIIKQNQGGQRERKKVENGLLKLNNDILGGKEILIL